MRQPFIINTALVFATCVSLTACGEGAGKSADPEFNEAIEHSVEVADGRYYDCFVETDYAVGGIECEPIAVGESEKLPKRSHNPEIAISVEQEGNRKFDCFVYTKNHRGGLSCILIS